MKPLAIFFALLLIGTVFYYGNKKTAFALPAVAEWKTGNFSIETKDWDNPLGIEGLDNSGLNQSTCTYQVESLNPLSGAWDVTRVATQRICADPIPVTVGLKTGEGYKGTTDIQVKTTDCKYSGENSCRITAWAQDYANNNSFGTEYMLTRIYSIDFRPPTITINEIKRISPDPKVITNNWFKAGIYEISISVSDNVGGSGVDTAYGLVLIRSRGDDDTFDTPDDKKYPTDWIGDNKFSVWVGPDDDPSHPFNSPLNDCVDEEEESCRVEIYVRDLAGNLRPRFDVLLNIDYTAPTAK